MPMQAVPHFLNILFISRAGSPRPYNKAIFMDYKKPVLINISSPPF